MDFVLPDSLSALRNDETFARHNVTIDPGAFRAVIRHANLGCNIGNEGRHFQDTVNRNAFEELMSEDPALYEVLLLCFRDIGKHAEGFMPSVSKIRELGPQIAQFAGFSDDFLKLAMRIMKDDTSLESGLELISCCRRFVDRCCKFENFVQKLFDSIVKYHVFAEHDSARIKELNARWDKIFPSPAALSARVTDKTATLLQKIAASQPIVGAWDMIFHSGEVKAKMEENARSMQKQLEEFYQWQAGLERVYLSMDTIDEIIDLSLESAVSCERSLGQLKNSIAIMIVDAESFADNIDTVVERLQEETNDISDLEIYMQISVNDVESAQETRGAMHELGERLAGMLSG